MSIRLVVVCVEATDRHCENYCDYIDITHRLTRYVATCTLFKEKLEWDKRKKTNGYKRLSSCKLAEQHER